MGCGRSRRECEQNARNRKQVSVEIGDQVMIQDSPPSIIFIFGGPGSRKAKLIEKLVDCYGLTLINTENILYDHLFQDLPENERTSVSFTPKDVAKVDTEMLTLSWLLERIAQQIHQNTGSSQSFLVDIMPSLKSLLNSGSFLSDCSAHMETFTKQHATVVAVNVVRKSSMKNKRPVDVVRDVDGKPSVCSDEADVSRTKKRAMLYCNCVQPFIDFFQKAGCLVSIDITGVSSGSLWSDVCRVFSSLHMSCVSRLCHVLIFLFDRKDCKYIEPLKSETIHLRSLSDDPELSVSEQLSLLANHLNSVDPGASTFIIDVTGTCLSSMQNRSCLEAKKRIVFVDEECCNLPQDIPIGVKVKGWNSSRAAFRAVTSTEDVLCFFPHYVPLTVCQEIASSMCRYKSAG